VRGPDIFSKESASRSSVAEAAKVVRNHVERGGDCSSDVLPENKSRPCFDNNPEHFSPEHRAGSVEANAEAGDGHVLAGASANDAIHDAAKRSAVKGGHVVPDRSARQGLVFHPCHEDGRSVGFPLDVHHRLGPGCEGDSESESAVPSEELGHPGR
jgi:hypothetical protein